MLKIIGLLIACITFIALNSALRMLFDLKADFSATGLHSNYGRIDLLKQSENKNKPADIVLLGSSMMGRLLPQYFQEGANDVINLGIDGGGGNSALELFLASELRAKIAVVELNGLGYNINEQGAKVIEYASSAEADLRVKIPMLSYQSRPSDLIYTLLKRLKDSSGGGYEIGGRSDGKDIPLTIEQKEYLRVLSERIKSKADCVVFVEIPSIAVANRYLVEHLTDLGFQIMHMHDFPIAKLRTTDEIHLNLPSAKLVSNDLVKFIEKQ